MSHGETIKRTEKVGKWERIMIKESKSKGKIYAFIYIYRFIRIYIYLKVKDIWSSFVKIFFGG